MTISICPVCEVGAVRETTFAKTISHRGKTVEVGGLVASVCQECGELSFEAKQIRLNQALIAHARKELTDWERTHYDRVSSRDIVRLREKMHLSQVQASKVFGGGSNAFSKYERGDVLQSEPMDILMRCAMEVPEAAAWLMSRAMANNEIPKRAVEQPGRWMLQRGFNPAQDDARQSGLSTEQAGDNASREWSDGKLSGAGSR